MSRRFLGRRGSGDDRWAWDRLAHDEPGRPRLAAFLSAFAARLWSPGVRRLALGLGTLAVLLIGTVSLGLALRGGGEGFSLTGTDGSGDQDGIVAGASQTPQTEPPQPSTTASSVSATPVPTAGAGDDPTVALWDQKEGRWAFGGLSTEAGYAEGNAVPFLFRWRGAESGDTYTIEVSYDCRLAGVNAIDFLAGVQDVGDRLALAEGGPGRGRPDSAVPLAQDPSLEFDAAAGGVVEMWGAVFEKLPGAPDPDTTCSGRKTLTFNVSATASELYLIGAAHLASEDDWGEGEGASSAPTAIGLEIEISSSGVARAEIAKGTLSR